MLETKTNGMYELKNNCGVSESNQSHTIGIPNNNQMTTQYSIGESSKDKYSKAICAEPEKESASTPPVISLILNDKSFFEVLQTDIDSWKELYPAVDILQELRKMKGWLDSNPATRKTRKGIKRFINRWLSKKQDEGGTKNYESRTDTGDYTQSFKVWD